VEEVRLEAHGELIRRRGGKKKRRGEKGKKDKNAGKGNFDILQSQSNW
jgi:hypothetical protein